MVGVLWGSAWMLTPSLPEPAMLAGAARFATAAALLAVAAFGVMRARRNARQAERLFPMRASIVLGFTLVGFPFALAVWAKDLVSAGMVPVFFAAMPLLTVLLGEKTGEASAIIPPVVAGMGGVAFLVAQGIEFSVRQLGGVLLLGAAVGLGAWSLNYAKKNIQPGNIFSSSAIQCAVASALLLILSGTGGVKSLIHWRGASMASLAVLAATDGAIALPLLFWLLSRIKAWQVASLQWMATLVAVAEAGVLSGGRPTVLMELGAAVVVVAITWLMRFDDAPGSATGVVTLQITSSDENTAGRLE